MLHLSRNLILASNSPRRKQLLADAGLSFRVEVIPTDESYPPDMPDMEVAAHIASQKAEVFRNRGGEALVLTADTVVISENQILGKPADRDQALEMLRKLSGQSHQVITAVSLLDGDRIETWSDVATVHFRQMENWELDYYVDHYKPFDKAGAYGIQEWIGMVGIDRIEGSFYTIMGLPVHLVYRLLKPYFLQTE